MDRLETSLTRLLGIEVPVIQAPIGSGHGLWNDLRRRLAEGTASRAQKRDRRALGGSGPALERKPPGRGRDGSAVPRRGSRHPLLRRAAASGMTGDVEALAFYAGQSAGLANRVRPAAEILRETVKEALDGLSRLSRVPK